MQYVVKQGDDAYSLSISLYGDLSYMGKLVSDNSALFDLGAALPVGVSLYYDETIKVAIKPPLIVSNAIIGAVDNNYIIKEKQSIYDLAITYGYGLEGVIAFIQAAGIEDMNQYMIANKNINVTKIKTNMSDLIYLNRLSLGTNIEYNTVDDMVRLKIFNNGNRFFFNNGNRFKFNT